MTRVLIAGPVRQDPEVLKLFLASIVRLKTFDEVDLLFVDDNESAESQELLSRLQDGHGAIIWKNAGSSHRYHRSEVTHEWSDDLVWRVAAMKDRILEHAREHRYDYVLLIDSDVLVAPDTLDRLVQADKDILCNVFWTCWQPNTMEMPQVWLQDMYSFDPDPGFIARLRTPGIYEVGGLGACTLISRRAIEMGVRFARIHNVSFWGEDRHFCIRAVALGLQLFVDTRGPGFHVYRKSDVPNAERYLSETNVP